MKYLLVLLCLMCACEHDDSDTTLFVDRDFWPPLIQEFPGDTPTIVFMGDSRIQHFPVNEYWPDQHLVNLGFGGITTRGVQYRAPISKRYDPNVIIISAGINDILGNITRGLSPSGIGDRIRSTVLLLQRDCPGASIYVTSIVPTRSVSASLQAHRYTADIIDLCLETGAGYIDMAAMEDAEGLLREDLCTDDGIHYSDAGYDLFSAIIHLSL